MPRLRILLDECIDWRLGKELSGHTVKTVSEIGWNGLKNGDLLSRAQNEFDVFITTDRNLTFQQNVSTYALVVIVLAPQSNRLQDILPLVPKVLKTLPAAKAGKAIVLQS